MLGLRVALNSSSVIIVASRLIGEVGSSSPKWMDRVLDLGLKAFTKLVMGLFVLVILLVWT